MGFGSHTRALRGSKFGEGTYFYHVTFWDRLESIKKLGLATQEVHGMGWGYTSVTNDVRNRLFLYPKEQTAFEFLVDIYTDRQGVLLRFKREIAIGHTAYHDPNYAQNETRWGKKVTEVYSFSVNMTISPGALEGCSHLKRLPGFRRWAGTWVPLEQMSYPTTF